MKRIGYSKYIANPALWQSISSRTSERCSRTQRNIPLQYTLDTYPIRLGLGEV